MVKKSTNALIVFIKAAELGKVKTRLAKDIGDQKALQVYKRLLHKTAAAVLPFKGDLHLFFIPFIDPSITDVFREAYQHVQEEGDLGHKMKMAFDKIFSLDYSKVCIIGSDCFEIRSQHIEEAFNELSHKDYVIGPSFDGGYYLLGMKRKNPQVFDGINWSTEEVCEKTIQNFGNSSYVVLTQLNDIDTLNDLEKVPDLHHLIRN